jgi:hypothetical protein
MEVAMHVPARLLVATLATVALGCPANDQRLRVVATSPPSRAVDVPVTTSFSVTFNHRIDPASVAPGALKVFAPAPLGPPVDGTLTVNDATVTLTPAEPLPYDAYYHMDVSALRDTSGESLGPNDLTWDARTTFGDFDFATPLPRFVTTHYISPAVVSSISLFRSGVGHDYSDDFESCRSMKHYFQMLGADWSTVEIRSPVAGRVVDRYDEWAGSKLVIRARDQHAFFFEIFHVVLTPLDLVVGDAVEEGQVLGHHVGSQTYSDIALGVQTAVDGPNSYIRGRRYVSYFDVLSDALFADYQARGVPDRAALQISAAERDAAPLPCIGETFTSGDTLQEYFDLH